MGIRRINIFGGPGCGKSTVAANIFSKMKAEGHEIELVDEYVKSWAYEKREICSFDQAYLFTQQLRKEYLVLRNSNGYIVTDSPLVLSICYAMKYGFKRWDCLQKIANDFEEEYPSLNIILDRQGCDYKSNGRYEDLGQAIIMDSVIDNYVSGIGIDAHKARFDDHDGILRWVRDRI
ncbi:MAG: AAA family ATPase [Candidatus Lokiarchaeota archaeon]|nr:AAA family ATPase [Candidatus Lokiarchaeota archaeon]